MDSSILRQFEEDTRQSIVKLSQGILRDRAYKSRTPIRPPDGEGVLQVNDMTEILCDNLFRLAFYSRSTAFTAVRKRTRAVISYSGATRPVAEVVLPGGLLPRVIVCLMNSIDNRWTKNSELEISGYIPLRWGLHSDTQDYRADVRVWPEPDCLAAEVVIRRWQTDTYEGLAGLPQDGASRLLTMSQ